MDKKFAKKFLLILVLLFVATFVMSVAIVFGVRASGKMTLDITVAGCWLLSLICALIPTSMFNGFVAMLGKIQELSNKQSVALVLLVLPICVLAVPVGAIMLLPQIVKMVGILAKDEH